MSWSCCSAVPTLHTSGQAPVPALGCEETGAVQPPGGGAGGAASAPAPLTLQADTCRAPARAPGRAPRPGVWPEPAPVGGGKAAGLAPHSVPRPAQTCCVNE